MSSSEVIAGAGAQPIDLEQVIGWPFPESIPRDLEDWKEVADRFAKSNVAWSQLARHVTFSSQGYARVLLANDGRWNLWLLGWLPEQASPIHGHGRTAGVTRVLTGELSETIYRIEKDRALVSSGRRAARESQVIVEAHGLIHKVQNRGQESALSLHLYAPPLQDLVLYEGMTVRELTEVPETLGAPPYSGSLH